MTPHRPLLLVVPLVLVLLGCGDGRPPLPTPEEYAQAQAEANKESEKKKKKKEEEVKQPLSVKPETVQPPIWTGVVLRPAFTFAKKEAKNIKTGTGFAIKDSRGKLYLVTAAHLLPSAGYWKALTRLEVHTLSGIKVGNCGLKPAYLGQSVEFNTNNVDYAWESSNDMAIYPIDAGARVRALPLAAANPKFGDPVWFVGREFKKKEGDEALHPASVETVTAGTFQIKKVERQVMPGYSGCPIINHKGEVVGILTSGIIGDSDVIAGATIRALREHLRDGGVPLD